MSLKKYEAFVRTVELGSLTRAAEAMGSTQSRISHVLSATGKNMASSFCAGTGAAFG